MRVAFTSDIHIDLNGQPVLDALVARARTVAPDVLIIAGDIATGAATYLSTLLALKATTPRLLVVAGNHDVWTAPEALAKGLDSWVRLDKLLPALCAEAGAELLDAGPVEIDGIGFAGSLGWYDLTTREHILDAPMEAYREGVWGGLRWTDHTYAVWNGPDGAPMAMEDVARVLRERLEAHLKLLTTRRIVVATHTLPFIDQIHRKEHPGWRFVNAFMGSLPMGDVIRADPRVVLAIAGHTHMGSDLRLGRMRAVVSPLGYNKEWKGSTPAAAVANALKVVEL
ncbi:MAG: metallophosphoesterase [Pseudomonadota bacterium]|nr:metallophosphoesterase [Pseudomonadota bacterium]